MTLSRKSYQNKVISFNQYKFDILEQLCGEMGEWLKPAPC